MENRINKFKNDFPDLSFLSDNLSEIVSDINTLKDKENQLLIGSPDSPVGYTKVNDKYEIDPNFLNLVNDNLSKMMELKNNLQDELKPLLLHDINNSIKGLSSIKEKYIKNRMIDIILQVVTDEKNKFRMMTPISFDPLTKAIEKIPSGLIPVTSYDLSSATDAFKAYQALVSGMILTGAFANASKSFGYFARAGATPNAVNYYNLLSDISKKVKEVEATNLDVVYQEFLERYVDVMGAEEGDKLRKGLEKENINYIKELEKMKTSLLKVRDTINIKNYSKINTSPTLNSAYQFRLDLGEGPIMFDRLATRDVRGEYSVTAVYDALTNEAIDNLKLGDLVKSRINPNTGSAVVGLVSVGVPMDVVVKMLYQPLFAPLATGKTNRVDGWIKDIRSKYDKVISGLENETLSLSELDHLLDPKFHSFQSKSLDELAKILTPEEFAIQLKAFILFTKGYKIGEDMRAASTFLNLIRKHDVFVEDIYQLDDDLANKIGNVQKVNDDLVLSVNPDFAFLVPNLFETAPHVKQAYLAHLDTENLISSYIKIHGPEIVKFTDKVYSDLNVLRKEEEEKAQGVKAIIRRSLASYILAGLVDEKEITTTPTTIKIKDVKITLSKLRSYSNKVSEDIWKIKQFAEANNDNNYFLKNVSITRDSYSVSSIGFKSGVNLNPEDVRNITLGFKSLNRYGFDDGNVVRLHPSNPNTISKIQKDLLNYAVLNYGLQFSNSNFSNYINISMLKEMDERYNVELDKVISDIANERWNVVGKYIQHFTLSHILQNASRLPYIDFNFKVPVVPAFTEDGRKTPAVYDGVTNGIYFNLRLSKVSPKDGNAKLKVYEFIREKYKSNLTVFKKVSEDDDYVYYQKVAKVSEIFHKKLDGDINYKLDTYFDPKVASIEYHSGDANSVFTYSKLITAVSVNDIVYIYPNHNADRTERRKVVITGIKKNVSKEIAGYQITFRELESPIDEMIENGDVTKICKYNELHI